MRKIRLLEFSNQRGLGGTDKDSQTVMKYYDREKFEIFAASWVGGPRVKWIEDHGIPNFVEKDQSKMIEWIRDKKIDVVHFYRMGQPEPILIDTFKKAGIPVLIERNCFGLFDNTYDRMKINKHIVCSKVSTEIYKQRSGFFYEESKLTYIYCPTDMERFDNYNFTRDWNAPIFGRYSRKDPSKWHPLNVQCLPIIKSQVPEAKMYAIGLPDEYKKEAIRLGVMDMIVELPSPDDDAEILNFLNNITVFTHGSIYGESFGNTIAESMCAGLPVVTHTGGDSAQCELITNEYNGFYVDQQDVNGYANRIIDLLRNPEKKKAMGELGRQRARQWFDAKVITKQFEDIFIEEFKKVSGE
jgi:glycosyltransferase involved in cell wall biosynthesis